MITKQGLIEMLLKTNFDKDNIDDLLDDEFGLCAEDIINGTFDEEEISNTIWDLFDGEIGANILEAVEKILIDVLNQGKNK